MNGTLFFLANDGSSGVEVWKSDGSAAGTVLVRDIAAGSDAPNARSLVNVNGTLYFSANGGTNGNRLWKSNGTAAGTIQVQDSASSPSNLTNVDGTLYFTANDSATGNELWKSNGTLSGTVRVADIIPGSVGSAPSYLTNINGTLYFYVSSGPNGLELWKSDGTLTGTKMVKDIYPGPRSNDPQTNFRPVEIANAHGKLFIGANSPANGTELYVSDLTSLSIAEKAASRVEGNSGNTALTFTVTRSRRDNWNLDGRISGDWCRWCFGECGRLCCGCTS